MCDTHAERGISRCRVAAVAEQCIQTGGPTAALTVTSGAWPSVLVCCCRLAEENAAVRALAARGADALQQMAHQLAGASSIRSVSSWRQNFMQSCSIA